MIVLMAAGLVRLAPIIWSARPPGTDYGLHLYYAEQYLALGFPPGPLPYYQLGLTRWPQFPGGSIFFGWLSLLSGVPVFGTMAAASLLGTIECLGIFALARRVLGRDDLALFAAAAGALLPIPLEVTGWGGYPNLVALAFLPYALLALLAYWEEPTPTRAWTFALASAAVALSHHLSALWLGAAGLLFVLSELVVDHKAALRRVFGLLLPLIVAGGPMAPRALAILRNSFGPAGVGDPERFAGSRMNAVAAMVDPAGALSAAVLLAGLPAFFLLSSASGPARRLIGSYTLVTLLLLFGWTMGVPFHYWRALFFMGVPIALAAGSLLLLWASPLQRVAVAASLLLAWSSISVRIVRDLPARYEVLTPAVEEAAAWIRAHSGPDEVVVSSSWLGFQLTRLLERPLMVSVEAQDLFASSPGAQAAAADAALILEGGGEGARRRSARQVRFVAIRRRGHDSPDPSWSRARLEADPGLVRVFENADVMVFGIRP